MPVAEQSELEIKPIAVCVCTYKRPAQLSRLLDSLKGLLCPVPVLFVIVDNDGGDPGMENRVAGFRRSCGARVEYVIEKKPGISAARNAAFAVSRAAGARAVAMLDDDEWAPPDWLMNLLEIWVATGAGVVGGPVRPVFPGHGQELARYEWLWSIRQGYRGGRVFVSCTCNCLVDLSAAAILGDEPFPPQFGLTGGEDAVFFRRLHCAGVRMAWAEKAILFEEVSDARASMAWMRRRWYRQGNVGVGCEHVVPDPQHLAPLLKTALLCLRLPVYPFFNRVALRAPVIWLLELERIRGRVAAHMGIIFEEYGRASRGDIGRETGN